MHHHALSPALRCSSNACERYMRLAERERLPSWDAKWTASSAYDCGWVFCKSLLIRLSHLSSVTQLFPAATP